MEKDKECADVEAFQRRFGIIVSGAPTHLTRRKMRERVEFLLEELEELATAAGLEIVSLAGVGRDRLAVLERADIDPDLPLQADALVDLVYVAKGTAVSMGLPWTELWDDVHRANMAKQPGETKRRHRVDCVKPPGWAPPRTADILAGAGYRRSSFTAGGDAGHPISEGLCHDDL